MLMFENNDKLYIFIWLDIPIYRSIMKPNITLFKLIGTEKDILYIQDFEE